MSEDASELRWHPLLRQWVAVSAHRQNRPQMPADWCPFCPGSGRVPDSYDVLLYPNDFAAFTQDSAPFEDAGALGAVTGARGSCDVVLYSPDHRLAPSALTVEQWGKVIGLWKKRTGELMAREDVAYVSVFENCGVAIGVTMPHPHGQIYSFPFLPPLVEREVESAGAHWKEHGECLYCRILRGEMEDGRRVLAANDGFVAFLPFYGRFPSEVNIYSRRHFGTLEEMTKGEAEEFAGMLRVVRKKYDALYGFLMPLMMLVRQAPARGAAGFHFHVEFLPVQRSATKLKYLAAVESGNGTFLNDTRPEEMAERMRGLEIGA